MRTVLFFLLVSVFYGCFSEDEKKAIAVIQELTQAENITVGSGSSIGTGKGSLSYKSLTLKSGPVLNNPNVRDEDLSSLSALSFYRNLNPETLEGKDAIKIDLERNLSGSTRTIETTYYLDTLRIVDSVQPFCNKFCEYIVGQYNFEAYELCAEVLKKDAAFDDFKAPLEQLDSLYGKPYNYKLSKFDMVYFDYKGKTITSVLYTYSLKRDSTFTSLKVSYSLHPDLPGIIAVQFNEP